jgi:hypothetical protein
LDERLVVAVTVATDEQFQIAELRLKRSRGNENTLFYSVVEPTIAT